MYLGDSRKALNDTGIMGRVWPIFVSKPLIDPDLVLAVLKLPVGLARSEEGLSGI